MWKKTANEKPPMAKTVGEINDTWWHSDSVIGKYLDHLHHSDNTQPPRYRVLRYEAGKGWRRWRCPLLQEIVQKPDEWCVIPEEK